MQLLEAIGTGRQIGWHTCRRRVTQVAGSDLKVKCVTERGIMDDQRVYFGCGWREILKAVQKRIQGWGWTLCMNDDAAIVIMYPPANRMFVGDPIDEGTESDALNNASNLNAAGQRW